jgi:hypothetical protein
MTGAGHDPESWFLTHQWRSSWCEKNLLRNLTISSHGLEVKYFTGQPFYIPKDFRFCWFLKKAICKKLQQAVKFHRQAMYFYFTLSHSPWIPKQTRSACFRKTFPVSFQENFLEISNTQTGKYNREVSSKFVYDTETNCHYKLLEPLFVAESWPMCLIRQRHVLNCRLDFAPHSSHFQHPAKREMLQMLK